MANGARGEVEAVLGGRSYTLCLTLGALAELEAAYGDGDLVALAERFETGRIGARDAIRIIGAGLRGAGHTIGDDEVAAMGTQGGAVGYVRIVARLLRATFPDAGAADSAEPPGNRAASPARGSPGDA